MQPGSGSTYTTSYTTGGSGAAVVSSSATITAPDSPTLTSMTATIQNPMDGSNEQLSATTTGTNLTSNYANGVVDRFRSGRRVDLPDGAAIAAIQRQRVDLPTSARAQISIVVNDGTDTSPVVTTMVSLSQGANTAPGVTTQPSNQTAQNGTATFTAAASGNPTPSVQWMVSTNGGTTFSDTTNGSVYSGSTTGSLTISSATTAMSGYEYEAVFTNAAGNVTTSVATLTVQNVAPAVTLQPTNQTAQDGTATFTAAASGTPSPTVQWEVSTNGGNDLQQRPRNWL